MNVPESSYALTGMIEGDKTSHLPQPLSDPGMKWSSSVTGSDPLPSSAAKTIWTLLCAALQQPLGKAKVTSHEVPCAFAQANHSQNSHLTFIILKPHDEPLEWPWSHFPYDETLNN